MTSLAKIISVIFGPVVLWPLTLLVIMTKSGLSGHERSILPPILFLLTVIPFLYVLLSYRKNQVSDLDLYVRKERYVPLFVTLICLVISLVAVYYWGNEWLLKIYLLSTILAIVNTVITFFGKISFHLAVGTISVILLNYVFNWSVPALYVVIPLLFWSRLYLHKHSVNQLLAGFLVNGTTTLLFIYFAL